MDRVELINHNGKEIVALDFSNVNVNEKEIMKISVEKAKGIIASKPQKSVLVLTNLTNTGFDLEVSGIMKEYANHNTPYVKASALVGVSGLQKIILNAVKKLTGREYYLFDKKEEALDWLVKQ